MMTTAPPIITLMTDFGDQDNYVSAMKGVILGIVPHVQLVDITHQIRPQDVQQAALILSGVYRYFPPHTVHLVVVDPGVGGQRRPIILETSYGRFVAPDNGVLTYVRLQEPASQGFLLDRPDYWLPNPSYTFHGRDIFSPVAAHLANGVPPAVLGTPISDPVLLPLPALQIAPGTIRGEVLRVDRFGNVLTNIMRLHWVDEKTVEFQPLNAAPDSAPLRIDARSARVTFSWHSISGIYQTYSQVRVGQALMLIGSNGELEIAINRGNASSKLAIKEGDPVTLIFETG